MATRPAWIQGDPPLVCTQAFTGMGRSFQKGDPFPRRDYPRWAPQLYAAGKIDIGTASGPAARIAPPSEDPGAVPTCPPEPLGRGWYLVTDPETGTKTKVRMKSAEAKALGAKE